MIIFTWLMHQLVRFCSFHTSKQFRLQIGELFTFVLKPLYSDILLSSYRWLISFISDVWRWEILLISSQNVLLSFHVLLEIFPNLFRKSIHCLYVSDHTSIFRTFHHCSVLTNDGVDLIAIIQQILSFFTNFYIR